MRRGGTVIDGTKFVTKGVVFNTHPLTILTFKLLHLFKSKPKPNIKVKKLQLTFALSCPMADVIEGINV